MHIMNNKNRQTKLIRKSKKPVSRTTLVIHTSDLDGVKNMAATLGINTNLYIVKVLRDAVRNKTVPGL